MRKGQLYCSVTEAGRLAYNYSQASSYRAVKSGGIPVVRVNGRMMVPLAELRRLAGLDPQ